MPKSKSKSDVFPFLRNLFGKAGSKDPTTKVEQRKADEEVLDRGASVSLAIAEHFAPLAMSTNDPQSVTLALAAVRESRECVRARKEATGGGLAGGTQTGQSVTVRIEHSGEYVSDDFHDFKAPSSNEPRLSIPAGSSQAEQ